MTKTDVAVVIPIYKTDLDSFEKISLEQCLKTLSNYSIYIVMPENTPLGDLEIYKTNLKFKTFPSFHFQNINSYSKLLLSKGFYQSFSDFTFILIHQLDVFVFKDELMEWCEKDYDYIGAPWINEQSWLKNAKPFWSWRNNIVGNGGFSLRKVPTFIKMLKIFRLNVNLFVKKNGGVQVHEDLFWSLYMPSLNPFFRIPDTDSALRFSFETYPSKCFERNNKILPFGCHGWMKYDLAFWKPFITNFGFKINLI